MKNLTLRDPLIMGEIRERVHSPIGNERHIYLTRFHLSLTVPFRIQDLVKLGGPSPYQMECIRNSPYMTSGADIATYEKSDGQYAAWLTEAIAVLAFTPGGITAFGLHFEVEGFSI